MARSRVVMTFVEELSALRSQKRMSHPTELEFHVVLSHLTWVLGVKLSWEGTASEKMPSSD